MTNWTTKPKIATASAIIGVIVGASMGGQTSDDEVAAADKEARVLVQKAEARADAQVEDAVSVAVADTKQKQASLVDAAVAKAVKAEQSKRKRYIAAAVSKAVKDVKASAPKPKPKPKPAVAATDPRFDTCGEANAAGYGNYRQGSDPEYDWYQDRDGDGSVCE